ncbi:MAG TPA: hypothetical protein VL485_03200 [Ktedonobacteraceae bacterium]|jgi:hypothetical protein|nr:hypothetical protein [Ktedonobacteraceae bacterium]
MWPFDNNNHQEYQQYAQAYDSGYYDNVDPNQASFHLQQFVQGAPPDMQQQIYQQHFGQLPYEQRVALAQHMPQHYNVNPNDPFSMAQGFMRMGKEHPDLLQRAFSHPLLIGCMVGLTGLVAKHVIDHHHRQNQNQVYEQPVGYGNPNPYMQQELNREQQEIRELRNELQEERREERWEEGEGRHHHRRDY